MRDSGDGDIFGVLVAAAAVMAAGYALDVAGLPIRPSVLAGVGIVAALVTIWLSAAFVRPRVATALVYSVFFAVALYAMWMAAPGQLPVTNGPDVVHHLQLIHVIASTGRLPHDPAQYPYLLEMMNYTPGSHILAAASAAWCRTDVLYVVYPIAFVSAGIKAASLYELARGVLGRGPRAAVQSLAAPLLAVVPVYFFGSFVQFFFLAQVVSEVFATGMLLALVTWLTTSRRCYLWFASACGAGVVLSWPVWIVPAAVAAGVAAMLGVPRWRDRVSVLAIALGPAFALGMVHQALHRDAASIVTSAGAVTAPSIEAFGLGFLILAAAGLVFGVRERAARPIGAFLAATLLLSVALALMAARAGSNSFYMAFKMMYLAVLPAAVLGAVALARAADVIAGRLPVQSAASPGVTAGRLDRTIRPVARAGVVVAAILPVLVAGLLVRGRVPLRRPHGSLSVEAHEVGLWARDRVPPGCVDYFSRYWLTGYWLHLDVLGNPRLSDRMRQETFDFPDAAAKWIQGRGLPYAIVEDMSAIPREIRPDMTPLHQRGSVVLVRNARPAACSAR